LLLSQAPTGADWSEQLQEFPAVVHAANNREFRVKVSGLILPGSVSWMLPAASVLMKLQGTDPACTARHMKAKAFQTESKVHVHSFLCGPTICWQQSSCSRCYARQSQGHCEDCFQFRQKEAVVNPARSSIAGSTVTFICSQCCTDLQEDG
jgi:hypothetical protein